MEKVLKQLLSKETIKTENVIAFIEMLEESGSYDVYRMIDILVNGPKKHNINKDMCEEYVKDFISKCYKDKELTKITKILVNDLTNNIRIFFTTTNSNYEDYTDLYDIKKYEID